MMKTEPTALYTISSLISCEAASCRRICKGSYSSGDLNDNEILIVVKDGISSIVGTAGRFIRISIDSFTIFVSREKISSCSDTNSTIISDPGSSSTSGSALDLQQSLLICFLESFSRQLGALYIQRLDH